jgi:hypothetical protein
MSRLAFFAKTGSMGHASGGRGENRFYSQGLSSISHTARHVEQKRPASKVAHNDMTNV